MSPEKKQSRNTVLWNVLKTIIGGVGTYVGIKVLTVCTGMAIDQYNFHKAVLQRLDKTEQINIEHLRNDSITHFQFSQQLELNVQAVDKSDKYIQFVERKTDANSDVFLSVQTRLNRCCINQ